MRPCFPELSVIPPALVGCFCRHLVLHLGNLQLDQRMFWVTFAMISCHHIPGGSNTTVANKPSGRFGQLPNKNYDQAARNELTIEWDAPSIFLVLGCIYHPGGHNGANVPRII